ncbi:hypothetical protein NDU88_001907, partial [Pleurodeles waltl]
LGLLSCQTMWGVACSLAWRAPQVLEAWQSKASGGMLHGYCWPWCDLCSGLYCIRSGDFARVPQETLWRTESPYIHVSFVAHALHIHQNI